MPSAGSMASSGIGPDNLLERRTSSKAPSIRTINPGDDVAGKSHFLHTQPSFRSIATSHIDPHDTRERLFSPSKSLSERSIDAWCKFPSHTRPERTGPAGFQDAVDTHDFVDDHITFQPAERQHYITPQLREQGSKGVLRHLKELYLHERGDILRMQQGTRSSISAGGQVQYPDLELLPKLERELIHPSDQRMASSYYSSDQEKSPKFDPIDYEGGGYGSGIDIQSMPSYSDHVSILSNMYRQTIYGGIRTVSDSTESSRHASAQHNTGSRFSQTSPDNLITRPNFLFPEYTSKPLGGSSSMLSPSNSDPEMGVRRSTLDFAKDLKQHKMQSHQQLMNTVKGISERE